ncbi:IPT/TIG domain-containing protein [Phyllobacterium leguminum]|uniref:IPT/TIG domain-containing protein n=2 Tax=Phyllobacterium leguminum TaxID=314237 RepID=A0A318T7T9_9HYPH|nr:IPT/TIG domain-containing protein [Phyllobacterium leguminum]
MKKPAAGQSKTQETTPTKIADGFSWNPNADQTFDDSYDAQSIGLPPSQLGKAMGTSFTMNSQNSLTLWPQAVPGDSVQIFGSSDSGRQGPTNITVLNGFFTIADNIVTSTNALEFITQPGEQINIETRNLSRFEAYAYSISGRTDQNSLNINMYDNSFVRFTCAKFSASLTATITVPGGMPPILSGPCLSICSTNTADIGPYSKITSKGGDVYLGGASFPGRPFTLSAPHVTIEHDVEIIAAQNYEIDIWSQDVAIGQNSTLVAQDSAQFYINGSITATSAGTFNVDSSAVFTFNSGSFQSAFDFANRDYPEGMFNFITQKDNNGSFKLYGDELNADIIKSKNLVFINGAPPQDLGTISFTVGEDSFVLGSAQYQYLQISLNNGTKSAKGRDKISAPPSARDLRSLRISAAAHDANPSYATYTMPNSEISSSNITHDAPPPVPMRTNFGVTRAILPNSMLDIGCNYGIFFNNRYYYSLNVDNAYINFSGMDQINHCTKGLQFGNQGVRYVYNITVDENERTITFWNQDVCYGLYTVSWDVFQDAATITSVQPSSGSVEGGTQVTIKGTNLSGATEVDFSGTAGTNLQVISDTELVVTTPPHSVASVDIYVQVPDGGGIAPYAYRYITEFSEPTDQADRG